MEQVCPDGVNRPPASAEGLLPLCVDLDGTLTAADTLWESVASVPAGSAGAWLEIATALAKGRAAFKEAVSRHAALDVETLPWNEGLLDYLRAEKARGRLIVLVTAAHRSIAEAVQRQLGLFDEVLATGDGRNLKGQAKAALLRARFGERGFVYAGDSTADLAVWAAAAAAVPVGVSGSVRRRIGAPVEREFVARGGTWAALAGALRVHQWLKNVLVAVPLVTSFDLRNPATALKVLLAAAALSLVASAQYLVNDVLDRQADRRHPKKRGRAVASGRLSIPLALAAAGVLLAAGIAGGAWIDGAGLAVLLGGYFGLSLLYSGWVKTMPLADVFLLAGLYVYRLVVGGEVSGHPVSVWLLNFSFFCFLSLAFLKRYVELTAHEGAAETGVARRGYAAGDAPMLSAMGVGSHFVAAVVLALYLHSETAGVIYPRPHFLWGLVPVYLLLQCRMWLWASRGWMEDDPVRFVLRDRAGWMLLGAGVLVYVLAVAPVGR